MPWILKTPKNDENRIFSEQEVLWSDDYQVKIVLV